VSFELDIAGALSSTPDATVCSSRERESRTLLVLQVDERGDLVLT